MWVLRIRSPSHPGSARATADNLSESFGLLLLYMQVKEERKRGKLSFSYFLSLSGYAQPPNAGLASYHAVSCKALLDCALPITAIDSSIQARSLTDRGTGARIASLST